MSSTQSVLVNKDIQNYLINIDPYLKVIFEQVDVNSFDGLPKTPYVALISAIIGQIIRYDLAKSIRSSLYRICGNEYTISTIMSLSIDDWNIIGLNDNKIMLIHSVNKYILDNNLDLYDINSIKMLKNINGINVI